MTHQREAVACGTLRALLTYSDGAWICMEPVIREAIETLTAKQTSEEPTDLVRQLPRLIYERRWLIEQLAGAWQRTEEEVAERLSQDSEACVSAMRSQQSGNSHE